jgi:hypothetical protein
MSKENLEQFMNKVADSEELQAKIGGEIDAKALIALGAECGCEFNAEELQESVTLCDGAGGQCSVCASMYTFNSDGLFERFHYYCVHV